MNQAQPRKSSTFPDNPPISEEPSVTPRHTATLGANSNGRASRRSPSRDGRGISPGTKLRDIFSSKKESSETADGEMGKSNGGGALGAMISQEKRNSLPARKSNKLSDYDSAAPTAQQATYKTPNQSIQSVPQIATSPRSIASTVSDAPTTTVTPPTPTDPSPDTPNGTAKKSGSAASGASGSTVPAHRRVRSDAATHGPSKLSNSMGPPLTPTVEEAKTPGGGVRTPGSQGPSAGAGGFFSSVFSAAQNAATSLTNTIANNPQRSRSSTHTEESKENIPGDQDVSATGVPDGEDESRMRRSPWL